MTVLKKHFKESWFSKPGGCTGKTVGANNEYNLRTYLEIIEIIESLRLKKTFKMFYFKVK